MERQHQLIWKQWKERERELLRGSRSIGQRITWTLMNQGYSDCKCEMNAEKIIKLTACTVLLQIEEYPHSRCQAKNQTNSASPSHSSAIRWAPITGWYFILGRQSSWGVLGRSRYWIMVFDTAIIIPHGWPRNLLKNGSKNLTATTTAQGDTLQWLLTTSLAVWLCINPPILSWSTSSPISPHMCSLSMPE